MVVSVIMKFRLIVLFSVGCFQLIFANRAVIREDGRGLLNCTFGVLDIQSASYERDILFCPSHGVTSTVQSLCQNKRSCTVHAIDSKFGDSCLGFREVLTITYRCIDQSTSSETTVPNAASMTTSSYDTTRWQQTETKMDHVTETNNQTNGNISTGNSMLRNTSPNETITIVTLIAGCIFGLLLIGILIIAIFRRFREKRDVSDDALVLRMSSLSQNTVNQEPANNLHTHSNGSVPLPSGSNVQKMATRYFGNNAYNLKQSNSAIISDSTISKYIDSSRNTANGGEYSLIEQYPADNLPPSYDSVRRINQSAAIGPNMNVYNQAHYSVDDYAKSNKMGLLQGSDYLSDGYSKATKLIAIPKHYNGKPDTVYANENINCNQNDCLSTSKSCLKTDNLLPSNKTSNPSDNILPTNETNNTSQKDKGNIDTGGNQYDDIDFNSSANGSQYQNIGHDDLQIKKNNQGYMPMEFGKSGSLVTSESRDTMENVYVPIMSPTCKSQSDVFDDTYQF